MPHCTDAPTCCSWFSLQDGPDHRVLLCTTAHRSIVFVRHQLSNGVAQVVGHGICPVCVQQVLMMARDDAETALPAYPVGDPGGEPRADQ